MTTDDPTNNELHFGESECAQFFINCHEAFAELSPDDQRLMIEDLRHERASKPEIRQVRWLFAEGIDGAEDEEIADLLRYEP